MLEQQAAFKVLSGWEVGTLGIAERKARARVCRQDRIVAAARAIAEREGWCAVTIRRLADEIEYSQPVLYSHFENRDAIVAAVAIDGFVDLTVAIEKAVGDASIDLPPLRAVATAYLAFARRHPAAYEAMFALANGLRFAQTDSRPELRSAFAALEGVVALSMTDSRLATETFWAALHGLAELERSGRIRECARDQRIALLVQAFKD